MFKMFPKQWTPVLPVAEVKDTPVAVELAGESLVIFRNLEGKFGALLNRCPHRGVPLSMGRVTENGCLECPYHGWNFTTNGACIRVPLNDLKPAQLSKLSVVNFPTKIIAGLIWVFTGTGNPPELEVPESLLQPENRYFVHHEVWNTHWTRCVENALDYLHIPFVHQNSFGRELNDTARTNAIAQINIREITDGMRINSKINTLAHGIEIDWHKPNNVVVKFDLVGVGIPVRGHIFSIPINAQQTRFMQVILANPGIDKTKFDFNQFVAPSFEDRVIVESQVGEVPKTTEECNVGTDEASLRFRRWYHSVVVD